MSASFKSIYLVCQFIFILSYAIEAYGNSAAISSHRETQEFVTKHLTLYDAIYLAIRNNPQVRSARLQRTLDKFALEIARNEFLPQFNFDVSATYSNNTKPFYDTNPQMNLLTRYGTQINLGVDDQINRGRQTLAKLTVTQPLLRGFGSEIALAQYHDAFDVEGINRLTFKQTLMTTVTSVTQMYYKLVQDYNNLTVDQLSLNNSLSLLKITQHKIKAGQIAPSEIVQQQAQVSNQRFAILRDQNNISQNFRNLLVVLGLDPRSSFHIDKIIATNSAPLPTLNESIRLALANNIEYQKSLIVYNQLERAIRVAKDEQKWKLDVVLSLAQQITRDKNFAGVDLNDVGTIGNDTANNQRTITLNLNIPIHDLSRKQKLIKAKIAMQQFRIALADQKNQLTVAVTNLFQNLQTQIIQINLAQDAVNLSSQGLEIAKKKLQFGRTTMFEVITLQKNLTQEQINLINQKISFFDTQAQFENIIGTTLNKWGITINY
jgi:outer membrane protein